MYVCFVLYRILIFTNFKVTLSNRGWKDSRKLIAGTISAALGQKLFDPLRTRWMRRNTHAPMFILTDSCSKMGWHQSHQVPITVSGDTVYIPTVVQLLPPLWRRRPCSSNFELSSINRNFNGNVHQNSLTFFSFVVWNRNIDQYTVRFALPQFALTFPN